jgi:hypothetical protein
MALVLVGAAVGTSAAVMGPQDVAHVPVVRMKGQTALPTDTATPAAPSTSASASASGSSPSGASTPANQPSASAAPIPFSALVGQWKPADGTERYLIIYPDRVLGIGQAGSQGEPLCAGRVQAFSAGVYPISVACSDYGTSGLSLSVGVGQLTLHVASANGQPAQTVAWVRAQLSNTVHVAGPGTVPPWLVATWGLVSNPSYESFTVAADGTVSWSMANQLGTVRGTAVIEPLSDGTIRVHTSFGAPAVDGFWQFAHTIDGHLQVIGAYGPNEFDFERPSPSSPTAGGST